MRVRPMVKPLAPIAALASAALTLATLALAAPAAAQTVQADAGHAPSVDEVIVMGRRAPDRPRHLSQPVSYDDLDLTTYAGQEALSWRVRATARALCHALGQDDDADAAAVLGGSCEDKAVRNARQELDLAVRQAYADAGRPYVDLALVDPYARER